MVESAKGPEHRVHVLARWYEDYSLDALELAWPTLFGVVAFAMSDEYRKLFSGSWMSLAFALSIPVFFGAVQWVLVSKTLKKRERLTMLRREIEDQKLRHSREVAEQQSKHGQQMIDQLVQHRSELAAAQTEVRRLTNLREIRALQVEPFIFSYLQHLALREFDFGVKPHESERLTLFLHDDRTSTFRPICRYSNSAEFSKCRRDDYPVGEGCLGRVWSKGLYCNYNYPDPVNAASYIEASAKDNFPRERVEQLKMKARMYCGTVIWSDEKKAPIAVLLLEAVFKLDLCVRVGVT